MNEGRENWNKGIAIALDIPECGESCEGEGVEVSNYGGDESKGWRDSDCGERSEGEGVEVSIYEGDESRGWRDSDCSMYERDESSVVLDEGDHLGQRIYEVIREGCDGSGCDIGGYNSGCDFNETGLNPIVLESAVFNDKAPTNDIPLILQWSNYLKAGHNPIGGKLYIDEAHVSCNIDLSTKRLDFMKKHALKAKV